MACRSPGVREAVGERAPGHLIVVAGVPSAGKTAVSHEIAACSAFQYFDGDAFIRTHALTAIDPPPSELSTYARTILERMLGRIEDEQQRREAGRGLSDPQRAWAGSRTDLVGPHALYDLVLDTTTQSPASCAEQIVAIARGRRWMPGTHGKAERAK